MPNKQGGKNYKRGKKGGDEPVKKELPLAKLPSHRYAVMKKLVGGNKSEVSCMGENDTRIGIIPGSFYKRVWIRPGDVLLVDISDLKTMHKKSECTIIHKYDNNQARTLRSMKLINFDIVDDEKHFTIEDDDENESVWDKVKDMETVEDKKESEKKARRQKDKDSDISIRKARDTGVHISGMRNIDIDKI